MAKRKAKKKKEKEIIIDDLDAGQFDLVAVLASDWCYYENQAPLTNRFTAIDGIIVGILIDEDDDQIVLAHQVFPDEEQVRHVSVITKSSIQELYRIPLANLESEI